MDEFRFNLFVLSFSALGAYIWITEALTKDLLLWFIGWLLCVLIGAIFGAIAAALFDWFNWR